MALTQAERQQTTDLISGSSTWSTAAVWLDVPKERAEVTSTDTSGNTDAREFATSED